MKQLFNYGIALLLGAVGLAGCIENDIPYPVEELEIVALEGEGFTVGSSDIDRANRVVTLRLDETTDIRSVKITRVEFSHEGATSNTPLVGTFDMRTPIYASLSLYQNYDWTLVAHQEIARSFTVEGQVGSTEWDLERFTARAYVPQGEVDLKQVKVTSLKLGPEGITTMNPSMEELTSFEGVCHVDIRYHEDVTERWHLYVIPTEVSVLLTRADAWSEVIWLEGAGKSGAAMGFRYRKAESDESWQEVEGVTVEGGAFKARLRVEAESRYEVVAYCDNETTAVTTVQTERTEQLPNAGLEEWATFKDILYPYLDESAAFWGSGNPGAYIAGKAILTQPVEEPRPGSAGNYSAELKSNYANVAGIGRFAAGNLYTGTYVKNAGANGIITFGRPFTLRPTALRLWIRYNCGIVDRVNKLPAGASIAEGTPDMGSIYIALGTWTKEAYGTTLEGSTETLYGTDQSPICIDTRNEKTFFDRHSEAVVGYGELLLGESVGEWTQVTIPIDYVATDILPTHIIIACSASRYGDYFSGSTQSVLYVDDIELLYF